MKALVKRTNIPGATQKLAQFEKLPIYAETAEVAKVLYDMLADLDSRLSVLETVDRLRTATHRFVGTASFS